MTAVAVAAADLGASGGRVMVGQVGAGRLDLHEAHRFGNVPVRVAGTLHWDILRLYQDILDGLRAAARTFDLASVGIDSWAVDYGLLDADGALLGNPVHYRDGRTDGVADEVLARIPAADLYAATGVQQLPFNTIYQLTAAARTPQLAAARTLLLIPDLLGYWLTGEVGAELTNASTTQLYDARAHTWAAGVIEAAGLPPGLFPPLRQPGSVLGNLRPEIAGQPGLATLRAPLPVVAVGSHDTASAVVSVPAAGPDFGYISCGTWSLVGVELDQPVLTEASRLANFSNEAGVDGTIRYLRNVMGLWLLQESVRGWADAGPPVDLPGLLGAAARQPPLVTVIDPDDPAFLPPGDMPARITAAARADRPAGAGRPARPGPVHPGQPGAGLPAGAAPGAGAVRAAARRGARGRRRIAERPAAPAHRGCLRAAGAGRPGRGHRAGQHPGPGPGAGRRPRRPGRHARAAPLHPAAALLRAVRPRRRLGGRGAPDPRLTASGRPLGLAATGAVALIRPASRVCP